MELSFVAVGQLIGLPLFVLYIKFIKIDI